MQSHSNICCKLVLKYSQNCEKGFTIFLCNSWSLLDFRHFFLILLSWLRNHVQSQQQKNKVRFGSSLRVVGWWGVPLVQVILVGFWVVWDGFCWLRGTSDGFRWFAVLVVTSVSQHTEHLTLYCTHGRTWLTEVIRFFYSK